MTIDDVIKQLPETAKDIRLNFSSLLKVESGSLSQDEVNAIMYAVTLSLIPTEPLKHVRDVLQTGLDPQIVKAAQIASALMSMNNIYYRFTHLSEDNELITANAGLRMQGMMQHGIDKKLFELMSLAVSAANGCGMCIQAHTRALRKVGADTTAIQLSGKIAAVVNAFNQVATWIS